MLLASMLAYWHWMAQRICEQHHIEAVGDFFLNVDAFQWELLVIIVQDGFGCRGILLEGFPKYANVGWLRVLRGGGIGVLEYELKRVDGVVGWLAVLDANVGCWKSMYVLLQVV